MAYDPGGIVVANATALSDDIDAITSLGGAVRNALTSIKARIKALKNPPAPTPAFTFAGPATIAEGNPPVAAPAYAFAGPSVIVEGDPPSAQYAFTGPANIAEGN